MYFGDILRLILIKKKIKVKDFAEKIGISHTSLSNVLQGRRMLKKEVFERIFENIELTEKERFDLKKAYSFEKMDSDITNYFIELEEENQKLKNILEAIQILKK